MSEQPVRIPPDSGIPAFAETDAFPGTTLFLPAGQIVITDSQAVITTILGSCVAVMLHDRQRGISCISHGLLPGCGRPEGALHPCEDPAHYVSCGVHLMVKWMKKLGARPPEIRACVVGGSNMFSGLRTDRKDRHLGQQNSRAAFTALEREGIRVDHSDIGGDCSRRLRFLTSTGSIAIWRSPGRLSPL